MVSCHPTIRREKFGAVWLEYPLFLNFPRLKHGVFLRRGGVSKGAYSSLNIGDAVGDDPAAVNKNRKTLKEILGVEPLISARQVHGCEVREINCTEDSENLICDGMVTNAPGIGLMIAHADCQAAILYDPVNHAAAAVHAGWRGSVQNIYRNAIAMMRQRYGSSPTDLHAVISPSLGPENAQFIHYKKELPEPFWNFQISPEYFDFWEISRGQLKECGLLPQHIEIAGICTYSNPEDYFSYRRDKVTGRHGTALVLL